MTIADDERRVGASRAHSRGLVGLASATAGEWVVVVDSRRAADLSGLVVAIDGFCDSFASQRVTTALSDSMFYITIEGAPGSRIIAEIERMRATAGNWGISVGLAEAESGEEPESLVSRAVEVALSAGSHGRPLTLRHPGDYARRSKVRAAIARGEFHLVFQPIVELAAGRVVGAEALVRWTTESGSLLSPAEFIPAMEASGAVIDVGGWVIREAVRAAATWTSPDALGAGFVMSVNVSGIELLDPDYADRVLSLCADAGLDPAALKLEVIESSLADELGSALANLSTLHVAGVGIAIDDFGIGHANLRRLATLPADDLKIDRSFVADVEREGGSLVEAILTLAATTSLSAVAEGIETASQASWFVERACRYGQGFYFSPGVVESRFVGTVDSLHERRAS